MSASRNLFQRAHIDAALAPRRLATQAAANLLQQQFEVAAPDQAEAAGHHLHPPTKDGRICPGCSIFLLAPLTDGMSSCIYGEFARNAWLTALWR